VYILYSKIPTDPGLLKIKHSHWFAAVVIQFFNSINRIFVYNICFIRINDAVSCRSVCRLYFLKILLLVQKKLI